MRMLPRVGQLLVQYCLTSSKCNFLIGEIQVWPCPKSVLSHKHYYTFIFFYIIMLRVIVHSLQERERESEREKVLLCHVAGHIDMNLKKKVGALLVGSVIHASVFGFYIVLSIDSSFQLFDFYLYFSLGSYSQLANVRYSLTNLLTCALLLFPSHLNLKRVVCGSCYQGYLKILGFHDGKRPCSTPPCASSWRFLQHHQGQSELPERQQVWRRNSRGDGSSPIPNLSVSEAEGFEFGKHHRILPIHRFAKSYAACECLSADNIS